MSLAAPIHRLPGRQEVRAEDGDLGKLGDELCDLEGDAFFLSIQVDLADTLLHPVPLDLGLQGLNFFSS